MIQPLITVALPVYNCASLLEITLKAIRNQTLPMEEVEILLLDGGSTDNTVEIARKYGAKVIPNPYRLPEPARPIALSEARGRYFVWTSSDEVPSSDNQLEYRIAMLQSFPHVKCLVYDREYAVPACGPANPYYVRVGDPFSMFTYRVKKGNLKTFQNHITATNEYGSVLTFQRGEMKPIGDDSTTFDLDFIHTQFGDRYKQIDFANRMFDETIDITGCCGIAKDDNFYHYTAGSIRTYMAKLRFRVINNIFAPKESGYSAREVVSPIMSLRRKQFYLYVLTLIGPIWDSVHLTLTYKDPRMLLHFFYTYYICLYAVYCLIRKVLGFPLTNKVYGIVPEIKK